jgi:hypothetical protein
MYGVRSSFLTYLCPMFPTAHYLRLAGVKDEDLTLAF